MKVRDNFLSLIEITERVIALYKQVNNERSTAYAEHLAAYLTIQERVFDSFEDEDKAKTFAEAFQTLAKLEEEEKYLKTHQAEILSQEAQEKLSALTLSEESLICQLKQPPFFILIASIDYHIREFFYEYEGKGDYLHSYFHLQRCMEVWCENAKTLPNMLDELIRHAAYFYNIILIIRNEVPGQLIDQNFIDTYLMYRKELLQKASALGKHEYFTVAATTKLSYGPKDNKSRRMEQLRKAIPLLIKAAAHAEQIEDPHILTIGSAYVMRAYVYLIQYSHELYQLEGSTHYAPLRTLHAYMKTLHDHFTLNPKAIIEIQSSENSQSLIGDLFGQFVASGRAINASWNTVIKATIPLDKRSVCLQYAKDFAEDFIKLAELFKGGISSYQEGFLGEDNYEKKTMSALLQELTAVKRSYEMAEGTIIILKKREQETAKAQQHLLMEKEREAMGLGKKLIDEETKLQEAFIEQKKILHEKQQHYLANKQASVAANQNQAKEELAAASSLKAEAPKPLDLVIHPKAMPARQLYLQGLKEKDLEEKWHLFHRALQGYEAISDKLADPYDSAVINLLKAETALALGITEIEENKPAGVSYFLSMTGYYNRTLKALQDYRKEASYDPLQEEKILQNLEVDIEAGKEHTSNLAKTIERATCYYQKVDNARMHGKRCLALMKLLQDPTLDEGFVKTIKGQSDVMRYIEQGNIDDAVRSCPPPIQNKLLLHGETFWRETKTPKRQGVPQEEVLFGLQVNEKYGQVCSLAASTISRIERFSKKTELEKFEPHTAEAELKHMEKVLEAAHKGYEYFAEKSAKRA